jgi:hypothetical protein
MLCAAAHLKDHPSDFDREFCTTRNARQPGRLGSTNQFPPHCTNEQV